MNRARGIPRESDLYWTVAHLVAFTPLGKNAANALVRHLGPPILLTEGGRKRMWPKAEVLALIDGQRQADDAASRPGESMAGHPLYSREPARPAAQEREPSFRSTRPYRSRRAGLA